MSGPGRRGGRTRPLTALVAAVSAASLLLAGCSDDDGIEPMPLESSDAPTSDPPTSAPPPTATPDRKDRHRDAALVAALPRAAEERHGLAVFEACTDFSEVGDCLGQEPGTVVLNLSDGMDAGLLLTVVRRYRPADFVARGLECPDGPIDDAGRQGTGERTVWEHGGWVGWVCDAEFTQVDPQGSPEGATEDTSTLRLLLAHDGHHLLSLRTAADLDLATWAEEYVDRLTG